MSGILQQDQDQERNRAIGVFDSGVGGLTVVSEIMKALPNENIVYFGDTARVPYGSKSQETVTRFSLQVVNFLLTQQVKAIIIACGTASSNSYEALTAAFDIPMIEVVRPGAALCLQTPGLKRVGVIGTERTIKSHAYEHCLLEAKPDLEVYARACPLFVPLAEEGWTDNEVARITAEMYLKDLREKQVDALILGCTHYPLLETCIRQAIGPATIINPAVATAQQMRDYLTANGLMRTEQTPATHTFYVSDNTEKFDRICRLVLDRPYSAEIVDIEAY